ncbi:MAG: peptidoglycan-binding protein [Prolixibacteraceae bacterium]|jgi:hypothetical protein|nr:peptidoglycan-binding protein [Prolixibacteraceae bacterium]MBT6765728.1 peptidoglycan-binding protein [Prolixibacteraceae bacterium]MBT6998203.1 peptidoglycan-binding protein [Prolixibacteraceae bacterium]MBT7393228.1 peptidoglycan-binding protein [Prolixibacteraceae bacterium]
MGNNEELNLKFLRYGSSALAIFAFIVGILTLIEGVDIFVANHEKTVVWFGLAVVAILIPYIKEITIKDLKVVIKDLKEAKKSLDATNLTSRQLQLRLTATRSELINGYQIYLQNLKPEQKNKKVIEMSRLYIEEMGLDIKKIKDWLKQLGYEAGKMDNEITQIYINSIREFQIKNKLGDDGIFGYRTYDKICQLIKTKD